MSSRYALALFALLACGCQCEGASLVVDLRSNLVPGVEFDGARTRIFGADRRLPLSDTSWPLTFGDEVASGVRVAEANLAPGRYTVTVSLTRAGSEMARRSLDVRVTTHQVSTVLITRDCRTIVCSDGLTCHRGQCLPQECIEGSSFDGCPPPDCARDDDCETRILCAESLCIEGACHDFPLHDLCLAEEWCHPEEGCMVLPEFEDAALPPGRDAGPRDAGGPCVSGGCDDANPCTDDVCDPDAGCTFTANDAPCDDGVFCNGSDQCDRAICALHAGDPCPGASTCDEAESTCQGCATGADCPAEVPGAWGPCGGFAGVCGNVGSRSREIRSFTCSAGSCEATARTVSEACTRASLDGTSCGATACGGWSGCAYSDSCDESANDARACTDRVCGGGTCNDVGRTETRACTRTTGGMSCGADTCDGWSGCNYEGGPCDETGERSRTCYTRTCSGGSCRSNPYPVTEPCTRNREGSVCGSNPSYCGRPTDCHVCRSGSCEVNTPHFNAACHPSCGVASSLCGGPGMCCETTGTCTPLGGGPFADCATCCPGSSCY